MKEKFEFRNVFNHDVVAKIAHNIYKTYPNFKTDDFIADTMYNFEDLGFGERVEQIYKYLVLYLPNEYLKALEILVSSLGEEIQEEELEGYDGFYIMPLSLFVARQGQDNFEASMDALYEMTKRFTSEFAIRDFFIQNPEATHKALLLFAKDENLHVRRLVSEGSRPRLPMAKRLHAYVKNPSPVFELLNALKNEPTRLVQRSIANNLNDIAKDHPDKVIEFLSKWKKEEVKDCDWIISHATRWLVKSGHKPTMKLLGFNPDIICKTSLHVSTSMLILGESLIFTCKLTCKEDANLIIDYLLHFKKANAKQKSKVFKLKTTHIKANETLEITKHHPLKMATTRTYYEGIQSVELQINGVPTQERIDFELLFKP